MASQPSAFYACLAFAGFQNAPSPLTLLASHLSHPFGQARSSDSARSLVSQQYNLSEAVEVTQWTDNQYDSHVVEEIEELDVLEEGHRWDAEGLQDGLNVGEGCEEENDADVVEGVEECTEVMVEVEVEAHIMVDGVDCAFDVVRDVSECW